MFLVFMVMHEINMHHHKLYNIIALKKSNMITIVILYRHSFIYFYIYFTINNSLC